MLLLRILASLLFHLPIVLSIPRHTPSLSPPPSPPPPPHHRNHHYNRSLEAIVVVAPLPPPPPPPTTTTIIEPIPFPLPPTTSFPLPPPTTTSDPWKDMCLPGQECDCSRIKDKNGEEYFQCVTNPRCDHCWINITTTTTTTTTSSSSLPSFSTPIILTTPATTKNLLSTDYRTLLPGTYTSSSHGTAHVVVVQQPASIHFVTLTVTREVQVTPLCEAVGSGVVFAVEFADWVRVFPNSWVIEGCSEKGGGLESMTT
ncbi:uncharacterized protein TRIREDRAFT_102938 [Trichoderma reesei QM6a]|uniref:Predicted protein n=2 Tax=Hypocrea jecorina TaxID=51453 RepID=G0R8P9_HYPJQ|nr:uncharacterized protein TRIREDRAFT_102938 [Trichoderma reesei QM6a]EGR52386.1 predicted protein [Trichoderma reesei QM6a]ETS06757.1 hypothetical protein M419DRAFT_126186 [Trichoderma reesei RUT C-30]